MRRTWRIIDLKKHERPAGTNSTNRSRQRALFEELIRNERAVVNIDVRRGAGLRIGADLDSCVSGELLIVRLGVRVVKYPGATRWARGRSCGDASTPWRTQQLLSFHGK